MDPVTAAAAILAGGQARRFGGRDKSRLVVAGRPIIVRQVEVLQRVTSDVCIVASDRARFADLGVPVHEDLIPGAGALGGIYTALEEARAECVLAVACDLPFLHEGALSRLVERAAGADGAWIRGPRGVEPLIACYQRSTRHIIRDVIEAGRLKAADLATVLRMAEVGADEIEAFVPIDRLIININSPADYARVQ